MASAARGPGDTPLHIELYCERCHRKPNPCHVIDVFVEMAPKVDTDVPFYLCVSCWLRDDWSADDRSQSRMVEVRPREQVLASP